jgi:excisionase family DNA binding protein
MDPVSAEIVAAFEAALSRVQQQEKLPRRAYSLAEVAQMIGKTKPVIAREIAAGKIVPVKVGREWMVSSEELRRWLNPRVENG